MRTSPTSELATVGVTRAGVGDVCVLVISIGRLVLGLITEGCGPPS
jgi:hypothetical protein